MGKKYSGRGGSREKSGRKKGSGPFGEKTKQIRLPLSYYPTIETLLDDYKELRGELKSAGQESKLSDLPFFSDWVREYLPNASSDIKYKRYMGAVAATPERTTFVEEDYEEVSIDEILAADVGKIVFITVVGDSMIDAGIENGDILAVEKISDGYIPKNGEIIIATVESSGTLVKAFHREIETTKDGNEKSSTIYLISANKEYPPLIYRDEDEQSLIKIHGIVRRTIGVIKKISTSEYLTH